MPDRKLFCLLKKDIIFVKKTKIPGIHETRCLKENDSDMPRALKRNVMKMRGMMLITHSNQHIIRFNWLGTEFIPFHKKTMSVYRWVIYIQSQSKAYKFIVNLLYWRRETSKNIFEVKVDLKSMSTAKTKMILKFWIKKLQSK